MAIGMTPESFMATVPHSSGGNSEWAISYSRELRSVVVNAANQAPRSVQRHLGPSELGSACSRQVVAKMARTPTTNHTMDPWASIVGTAIHAWLADAFEFDNGQTGVLRWMAEKRVTPDPELGEDAHPGTADLYDGLLHVVVDHKCLGDTTRNHLKTKGPPRHYFVQLLLYAMGYRNLGMPVDRVALAAWPRTKSSLDEMYVWEHLITAEDEQLVRDVISETQVRQAVAQEVKARRIDIMQVPPTPSEDACAYCLSGDTEVVTRQGIKPIRELAGTKPKLVVPTLSSMGKHMRRGAFREVPVSYFGDQELWKIVLSSGRAQKTVEATAEHGWYVTDRVRGSRTGPDGLSREWRKTTEALQPGDLLQPLRRAGGTDPDLMSVAAAQGFVFGDGSSSYNDPHERPAHLPIYDNGKDRALIPLFESLGFKFREYSDGTKIANGMPRFWKKLPPLDESRAFLLSWLAGYFAADGDVTEPGMCTLHSAVRENLLFVRDLAAVCGIGYRPIRTKSRVGIQATEATDLYSIHLRRRDLPTWFFLIDEHRRRATAANEGAQKETYWNVVSVERTGRIEPVYCATVDGAEAFALEGDLMTANCPLRRSQSLYDGKFGCPGMLLLQNQNLG